MEESSTYQAILQKGRFQGKLEGKAEGKAEGERELLIRQGTRKFGPPDGRTLSVLKGIADPDRLGSLAERLLDTRNWDELLQSADSAGV